MELFFIFFITILSFFIIAIVKKGVHLHRSYQERREMSKKLKDSRIIKIEEETDDPNEQS